MTIITRGPGLRQELLLCWSRMTAKVHLVEKCCVTSQWRRHPWPCSPVSYNELTISLQFDHKVAAGRSLSSRIVNQSRKSCLLFYSMRKQLFLVVMQFFGGPVYLLFKKCSKKFFFLIS